MDRDDIFGDIFERAERCEWEVDGWCCGAVMG